jgi:protein-tyrosine-phosphatase
MPDEKSVLFICVQNSARSQIAEAYFRKYVGNNITCSSAGTTPAGKINPDAITVMKEVGIDLSANKPKVLTNEIVDHSSVIINLGCMDRNSCPAALLERSMEDWGIEDPAGKSIEKMREVRDQIELKVVNLIRQLSKN